MFELTVTELNAVAAPLLVLMALGPLDNLSS